VTEEENRRDSRSTDIPLLDTARILAFTTLSMIPALIFYAFAERHLVRGLTTGAVKG